uniref:DUF676 domain-containing protein n=1 Tax=Picocystis salinarum TaxID=88271 RepID=A0A7S3UFU8_9CHLO
MDAYFLVHGLGGNRVDLSYLAQQIHRRSNGVGIVHCVSCNEGKTKDGVVQGGDRLAQEVKQVLDRHRGNVPLKRIHFVGNSLGGLYCRYAVAVLFEPCTRVEKDGSCKCGCGGAGRVAGLIPHSFVTIATPHLGVRKFKILNLPDMIYVAMAKRTGKDLLLKESSSCSCGLPLVARMAGMEHEESCRADPSISADEGNGNLLPASRFIEALGSFARRRLYANMNNDLLVFFGTASICLDPPHIARTPTPVKGHARSTPELSKTSEEMGQGDLLAQVKHLEAVVSNPEVTSKHRTSLQFHPGLYEDRKLEECMASKLNELSWEKFYMSYPGLPYAHAIISANKRLLPSLVSKPGQPLMDQLAFHLTRA